MSGQRDSGRPGAGREGPGAAGAGLAGKLAQSGENAHLDFPETDGAGLGPLTAFRLPLPPGRWGFAGGVRAARAPPVGSAEQKFRSAAD